MYVKTIKYTDFDGNERTEDFYFNLTEAELVMLKLSEDGGIDNVIKRLVNTRNDKEIIKLFQKIILMSYGVKSDDGKRFIKNDELRAEFEQTNAYSNLFMELATDDKAGSEFINNVIPQSLERGSNLAPVN